jgi:D-glycero-alpha-D-manno-heptose-7-phosphate kinase
MQSKESVDHARVSESLRRIKELGYRILEAIEQGNYDQWGHLLDEHWQNKKKLSKKISLGAVDKIYEEVRARFGVLGGKIIGAGGGGFLMLYCPSHQAALGRFMEANGMPRMHYTVEPEGTKVITQVGQGFLAAARRPAPGTIPDPGA